MTKSLNYAKQYSPFNLRLSTAIRERDMTITRLSEKANVAVGTIQKLMTDPDCNPTVGSLSAICKALNIPLSELIGEEENTMTSIGNNIPLYEWENLSDNLVGDPSTSNPVSFIKSSSPAASRAFALKMKGNTMQPLFPENTVLIFDPEKPFYDGCYVLVKLNNHHLPVFKQLLIDEPNRYIKSINPVFKDTLLQLENNDTILATLAQAQMQY